MATSEEGKLQTAVNGMSSPVTQHYTATSVEDPAPSINTAMPSVPNVQPTAPTMQPTQAQGAAPGNGMTFGASPMTRPTPTQLNARPTCECGSSTTPNGCKCARRLIQERQESPNTANDV